MYLNFIIMKKFIISNQDEETKLVSECTITNVNLPDGKIGYLLIRQIGEPCLFYTLHDLLESYFKGFDF